MIYLTFYKYSNSWECFGLETRVGFGVSKEETLILGILVLAWVGVVTDIYSNKMAGFQFGILPLSLLYRR